MDNAILNLVVGAAVMLIGKPQRMGQLEKLDLLAGTCDKLVVFAA